LWFRAVSEIGRSGGCCLVASMALAVGGVAVGASGFNRRDVRG
jgi:hypothetical protein